MIFRRVRLLAASASFAVSIGAACGGIGIVPAPADGGAPTVGPVPEPTCPAFHLQDPIPLKACTTDADCAVFELPPCGNLHTVIGIAKARACSTAGVNADCADGTGYPAAYDTDDYRLSSSMAGIGVACERGQCMTFGSDCNGPCSRDGVCVKHCAFMACVPIPAQCTLGSDAACALQLCGTGGYGGPIWTTSHDLDCNDCTPL